MQREKPKKWVLIGCEIKDHRQVLEMLRRTAPRDKEIGKRGISFIST
jgi:hypothetical protein